MTPSCMDYIGRAIAARGMWGEVLEVGSMDVNGSPRELFLDMRRPEVLYFTSYIGVDMRGGRGVDVVANCHALPFRSDSFDVVVDAERLEHDDDFFASYREIVRVLRPGGHVVVTTRSWGGFPPHDHPSDYWRFMAEGLRSLLDRSGIRCLDTEYGEVDERGMARAVFACGVKR